MELKDIRDVKDLKGKRVLLRSTLNVPLRDGEIVDDFRLRHSMKTIIFLKDAGAKIIIIGHIGRKSTRSLFPVFEYYKKHFPIIFTKEVLGSNTKSAIENMNDGDIVLLENLRMHEGEKTNNDSFAEELASFGDIYVNDAFSVSHRNHASIVGLPKYLSSYTGILFQEELKELSRALKPESPSLCILGGAKFATKEPLIEKFINIYDEVFVSGALAHDFFKARGFNIGKSLISDTGINLNVLTDSGKIMIPSDVTVENSKGKFIKKPEEVLDDDNIVDAGPETSAYLAKIVQDYKFILWNGPLGEYERGFIRQTEVLAHAIAKSSAKTLIGGGDTIASIAHLNLWDKFSFVSTGGGAMLKFLMNGTLVGIEAIKNNK